MLAVFDYSLIILAAAKTCYGASSYGGNLAQGYLKGRAVRCQKV
jgi:hypothetical protein